VPRELKKDTRQRAKAVLDLLYADYPEAATELSHSNPFQLLIATILSAQATDMSVNQATPALFARYPDAAALAKSNAAEVEALIKSIGLYRNKAKNIILASEHLLTHHQGEVPNDFDALLKLAGVGRKTANVVLSNAYGRPAIAVDTHVGRLARRLQFSQEENPDKVERDLQALFPKESWIFLHHALILHGRRVCEARNPHCEVCTLHSLCPSRRA
jgi:endonuclease-3